MAKRFYAAIIPALACLLCGCAVKGESIPAESVRNTAAEEAAKKLVSGVGVSGAAAQSAGSRAEEAQAREAGDEIWFLGDGANAGFGFTAGEYDYAFEFRGFYLSDDGEGNRIFIDPIEFVWPSETERWQAWGLSPDGPGTYASRNEKKELISIPITEDTEFHMWGNPAPLLEDLCDRSNGFGEHVTTRPEVFLYYLNSNPYYYRKPHDAPQGNWPFFMILDEEGNEEYVVENPLVG